LQKTCNYQQKSV